MTPDAGTFEALWRFVRPASVRPAVEVNCSGWTSDTPKPGSTGRFVVRAVVRPVIEVDCSCWGKQGATDRSEAHEPFV